MIILVTGVLGSGKTTVGSLLARQLGWEFVDADGLHSASNIEKMRHGIPLTDADRQPWLQAVRRAILDWQSEKRNVVLACSALKRSYREDLVISPEVHLVYLKGSFEVIAPRVRSRQGHFATQQLLASQFATLEDPSMGVTVEVNQSPEQIVAELRRQLKV